MITDFKIFENNFKVGDFIYAIDSYENRLLLNRKFKIEFLFDNGYLKIDAYKNNTFSPERFIHEKEYDTKKYNL